LSDIYINLSFNYFGTCFALHGYDTFAVGEVYTLSSAYCFNKGGMSNRKIAFIFVPAGGQKSGMGEAKKPNTKLISTVTAEFANNIKTIKNNLKVHLSSPVQWEKTVYTMLIFGINTFIEVGPTGGLYKTILGISNALNKDVEVYTTTDSQGLEKALQIQKTMNEKIVHSFACAI